MEPRTAGEAWNELISFAQTDGEFETLAHGYQNTVSYHPQEETITYVSNHHAASGEPETVTRPMFTTIWETLVDGKTLSRPGETSYTDLTTLLDDDRRASGMMALLATAFDEVEAATDPVRIWLRGSRSEMPKRDDPDDSVH